MTTPVTVRLPDLIVRRLDQAARAGRFRDRSAALSYAAERLVQELDEEQIVERYRRGYARTPQTDDEVTFGVDSLGALPPADGDA